MAVVSLFRLLLRVYNEVVKRTINSPKQEQAERELAFEMRDKLTAEDLAFLKAAEAIIDEHSELFERLAEE